MSFNIYQLFDNRLLRTLVVFGCLVLCVWMLAWLLKPVLLPIIISLVLYALFKPWVNRMVRGGRTRSSAALMVLITIVGINGSLLAVLVPEVMTSLSTLSPRVQRLALIGEDLFAAFSSFAERLQLPFETSQWLTSVKGRLVSLDIESILASGNTVLGVLANLILVPFLTFFIVRDYPKFRNRLMNTVPNKYFELAWHIYFRVIRQLQSYVRGLLIQLTIMALISALGFWLTGFSSPLTLGILVGLFGIIPWLGPLLGTIPPLLQILSTTEPQLIQIIYIFVVIGIAYFIDNMFVVPLFIANVVSLHPLFVIIGVIIFGGLFGVAGMVLAIPAIVVVKLLITGLYQGLAIQTGSYR